MTTKMWVFKITSDVDLQGYEYLVAARGNSKVSSDTLRHVMGLYLEAFPSDPETGELNRISSIAYVRTMWALP